MVQAVKTGLPSQKLGFDPNPCEICGGQNGIVRDFGFIQSVSFHHSSINIHSSITKAV